MAQVPVSGSQGGNVVQAMPLPDPQEPNRPGVVPISAFGGPQASAMARAAQDLAQVSNDATQAAISQQRASAQAKVEADNIKSKQADAALVTANNLTLYGDGTPDNPGLGSLHGQALIDAAPAAQAALNANRATALSSLSSTSQNNQDLYASHSAIVMSDHLGRVSQMVATARGQVADDASNGRIFADTNAAGLGWNDPAAITNAFQTNSVEIASMALRRGLPPEQQAEALAQQNGNTAQTIIRSALAADPSGNAAAALVKSFPTLPAGVTSNIQLEINAAQKTAQEAGRSAMALAVNDNLNAINAGLPVPHTGLSMSSVAAVLGPKAGPLAVQQLNDATSGAAARLSISSNNQQQDADLLAASKPDGSTVLGGEGEKINTYNALRQAIAQKYQALGKDPAAYVQATNPGIAPLVAGAIKDPTQWPGVAAAMDAQYDKLGLPPTARPVMPAATAQSFVASVTGQTDPAQAVAHLQGLLSGIPDDATRGRVMGDLVHAGLPPAFEALSAMPSLADQTAMASTIGQGKVLRDGLAPGDAKAIDAAIATDPNLGSLKSSFAFSPGGASKGDALAEAIKPMAYQFRQQGLSPSDAAAKAAQAVTGQFSFWDNGGQIARVPAGTLGAVEQHADSVVSSLTAPQLAAPANPSGINLTPDQLRSIALQNAQRGAWISNESGTGLLRIGANGSTVKLANGQRLEFPFAAVSPAGPSTAPGFDIGVPTVPGGAQPVVPGF